MVSTDSNKTTLTSLENNWDWFGRVDPLWAISSYKDKKGNKWDNNEFFSTGLVEIEKIMKYLESHNVEVRHNKALDFGCGVGRLTQALARYFDSVDGLDIAPSMIQLANRYNSFGDRVHYYLNNSEDLSNFSEDSYDFIYTTDVLQHIPPKQSLNYLIELIRILSPKGILIFQLPSENLNIIYNLLYILGISNALVNLYGKTKHIPIMEYHYVKLDHVMYFLKEHGAVLINTIDDRRSQVVTYKYIVTKL
jgi:2-polyprenyl-3-methyl-5-hydroxy-6-metoxy-1,4-benzoquinol methylase